MSASEAPNGTGLSIVGDQALRKITAIVRTSALEAVERRLHELHVPGISVTKVKGYGEYANFFTSDWTVVHSRVEIFLPRDRTDEVACAIAEVARSGEPGDGIVVVLPVDSLYHIRSGEIFASAEFRQPERQAPGPMPAPTAEAHHG